MKNKKLTWTIITITWVIVIWAFSLQPGEVSGDLSGSLIAKMLSVLAPDILNKPQQLEFWHSILRKCAHFTEYFILAVFSRNAISHTKMKYQNIIGIAFCVLIASVDETIQLFVPGRAGRVTDILIDSMGALVAIGVLTILKKVLKKNNSLD